ncbi:hypothetical protein [Paenirhodobacter populi]|uniref:hypothetical protein n=1 Tax=Paenirhodobacter populi TaxID=2306993 RepID=UPI000FE3F373|nr:hypothetical protein [Sinirhodobacter populi]RWR04565.1 hypothetical protein D2T32_19190 [Sinirhodobacter populi]
MPRDTLSARRKPWIVLWDAKAGPLPPGFGAADAFLLFDRRSSLAQLDFAARSSLEAHPWATVLVARRWAPVFVSIAARNLHLCVDRAVFVRPAATARAMGEKIALPLTPLAFPSVVVSGGDGALARHVRAWKSAQVENAATFLERFSGGLPAQEHLTA